MCKKGLGETLSRLLLLEGVDGFSQEEWRLEAGRLVILLKSHPDFLETINEEVWHYLSDIDIRLKDDGYKRKQTQFIREQIKLLKGDE